MPCPLGQNNASMKCSSLVNYIFVGHDNIRLPVMMKIAHEVYKAIRQHDYNGRSMLQVFAREQYERREMCRFNQPNHIFK